MDQVLYGWGPFSSTTSYQMFLIDVRTSFRKSIVPVVNTARFIVISQTCRTLLRTEELQKRILRAGNQICEDLPAWQGWCGLRVAGHELDSSMNLLRHTGVHDLRGGFVWSTMTSGRNSEDPMGRMEPSVCKVVVKEIQLD